MPGHRSLRQFLVLADELHFARAAARLHMTQPPLTQAIQRLEGELGAVLFERTQRSVRLSAAGAALLPAVQRLVQQLDALPALARDAAQGRSGRLRLAFVSSIAYGPLPVWLRSFRLAAPGVALELREATLDVQLDAFAAGDIDAGFVLHAGGAAPAALASWPAWQEPMVLALPELHPLAQRRRLELAAIADEPLVLFPRRIAPSLHDAVLGRYAAIGRSPVIVQEAMQMQTIVNLVSAGIGVAWVPQALTQLQRPGVVYRPLRGSAALVCQTSLVWAEPAAAVVQRFVDHVRASPARPPPRAPGRQPSATRAASVVRR